jgi:hypothetical protein
MWRIPVVACFVLLVACESDVVPTRFARSFGATQCWVGPGATPSVPCVTYTAASHQDWVDSGRITFRADNSVDWMLGTHTYQCPCYLGGCTTPCSHGPPTVTKLTGTYSIVADTVALQFSQNPDPSSGNGATSRRLYTTIPDRVQDNWQGPDSLVLGRSFGSVIFKTQ